MTNIFHRVKSVREALGLSQTEFAFRMGYSRNYVSLVERGENSPSARFLVQLDQLERESTLKKITLQEKPAQYLAKRQEESNVEMIHSGMRMIPVYSWVQAGAATDFEMLPDEWQDQIPYFGKAANVFGLIVRGDSMEPKYSPGSLVIANASRPAGNGDLVVANVKNRGVMFKRMHHTGDLKRIHLTSYNASMYPPIDLPREDFHWLYPVDMTIDVHHK